LKAATRGAMRTAGQARCKPYSPYAAPTRPASQPSMARLRVMPQ